jgi:TetR/AcrR family transcriptional regulator, fatty acid metabolism regulator protein
MPRPPAALARRRPSPLPAASPRRDAILDAATHVFAERGFFAAQVADVAARAGIAAGTVYLYFRSKDDLLISIFDRTMAEALAEARQLVDTVADPVERLRRFAERHLARLGRNRRLAVVFQVELRQSTKFMARFSRTLLREYLGLIRSTIAAGQARGVFRPAVNPTFAAKMFFGALDEMVTNWILSDRDYPLEADAGPILDLFVHGMGPLPRRTGV